MKKNIAILSPKSSESKLKFTKIDIQEILFDRSEISNKSSDELSFYEFLKSNNNAISEAEGIIIDENCTWKEAVIMILYLRLTSEWNTPNKPILWLNENTFEQIIEMNIQEKFYKYFFPNSITKFLSKDDAWQIEEDIEEFFVSTTTSSSNSTTFEFYVKPPDTSHQITNEWGAFKLAYTAGLSDLLPIIEEQQPRSQTIYFKYLKQKYEIPVISGEPGNLPPSTPTKRYLLIDDNHKKGWQLVFNAIFQHIDPSLSVQSFDKVEQFDQNEDSIVNDLITLIENSDFHGVLLDLRLTRIDDEPQKRNTDISNFTGGRLLKSLKEKFPFLPIIMVTASNKAWNMQQLIDAGADGYFIKEDPESFPSKDVSESNYQAFLELIRASNKKFETLSPFWKYIKQIEDERTLIDEKTENGVQTQVEKRIKERLRMFFGLLKRNYEDSTYNQSFYYSDIKLAFMTLWSCLNDIQYIYYEKSVAWTSSEGKDNYKIAIRQYLLDDLKFLTPKYLQEKDASANKFVSTLTVDYTSPSNIFQIRVDPCRITKSYDGSIGEQIAFLLLTFGESTKIVDTTSGAVNSNILSDKLADLKDKRNHLYLTHGNEGSASTFFTQLEKDNREISLSDCADLFNIIFFLLKGKYI